MMPTTRHGVSSGRSLARLLVAGLVLLLAGCADIGLARDGATPPPGETDGSFSMKDGLQLPMRAWLPNPAPGDPPGDPPWAVVLALHGFNDSRDAWEIPAPAFTQAGIALFSPDQRGFGATPQRGHWPGVPALVDDADTMVGELHRRYPGAKLYVMGESMGAAVLMVLRAEHPDLPIAGSVLVAPAVWGRAEMNVFLRTSLFLADHLLPGVAVTGQEVPVQVHASDNRAALIRLSRDPLTLHRTRFDTLGGLVDLMDAAQAAAAAQPANTLVLYGGEDDLVPKRATAVTWQALPAGARRAFYPDGHHLLLRDLERDPRIADIIAWMRDPSAPLPSGADQRARAHPLR
jgi:acylglycerol lipase